MWGLPGSKCRTKQAGNDLYINLMRTHYIVEGRFGVPRRKETTVTSSVEPWAKGEFEAGGMMRRIEELVSLSSCLYEALACVGVNKEHPPPHSTFHHGQQGVS